MGAWSLLWNKSPLHTVYKRRRTATARHGPSACRYCRNHGQSVRQPERYDESVFCCSRVGHAACQPDLRSDRQQSDLWRLRLGTKLPLLWCESITRVVRGWVSRNTHTVPSESCARSSRSRVLLSRGRLLFIRADVFFDPHLRITRRPNRRVLLAGCTLRVSATFERRGRRCTMTRFRLGMVKSAARMST
jgi:hypothetical protein